MMHKTAFYLLLMKQQSEAKQEAVALKINNALFCDTFLQDNPHRLTLTMSPEEKYHDKQAKMEAEKLEKKVNALSEEEKTQIFEKG